MKRTWDPTIPALVGAIVMLVGTVAATGGIAPGQWRGELEPGSEPQSIRLDVRLGNAHSQSRITTDVPTADLTGFDAAAFGRSGAPLHLSWKRDAGAFVLEGEGGRHAGGKVRFEPDAAFGERWRALGFETLTEGDFLRMAMENVRVADAERLHEMGYGPIEASTLVRLESEPDSMKWLEEMHAAGVHLSLEDLFRLRNHGVSVDDVRGYQAAGIRLDIENVIRLNDQGVDTAYVKGLIDAGVESDDLEGILRLHAHGVPTDYVARVKASGYPRVDVDDLVRLHDQGVEADYVSELVASHLPHLNLDDVVRLHAHGVPGEYVQAIVALGSGNRNADDVVRLHNHGVSADFVRSLAKTGRRDLSVDDVIHASTMGL